MPVICINPADEMDATLLEKLNLQNQDIRLFVSDNVQKKIIKEKCQKALKIETLSLISK